MFSPVLTRAQSLADYVERLVAEGGHQPGDRIATMEELRQQTGLGRATISEAARLLTERGTIDVRPGRGGGLFVAQQNHVVRLRHTLLEVGKDAESLAHGLAVRDALEELICLDATRHRTSADLADLHAILETMRAHGRRRDHFMQANWALHARIAEISPNDLARGVYLSTMEQAKQLPVQADEVTTDHEDSYLELRVRVHEELVAAIASEDLPRTSRAVAAHHTVAAKV